MDDSRERYYRPSGAVPFVGTLLMLGCGLLTAAVMSFLYAAIDLYNPILFITILMTVVCGGVIGGGLSFGVTLGNVRNPLYVKLIAVIIGLAAVYLTWMFYIWLVLRSQPIFAVAAGLQQPELVYEPAEMLSVMQAIAGVGLWGVKNLTPTGVVLYAIWLGEALILLGFTYSVGTRQEAPYCEQCGRWTQQMSDACRFPEIDQNLLCTSLEDGRWERLEQWKTEPISPQSHLRGDLYLCPACTETTCLSLRHLQTVVKKGDIQERSRTVIQWLYIPRDVALGLLAPLEDETEQNSDAPAAAGNIDDLGDDEDDDDDESSADEQDGGTEPFGRR